MSSGLADRRLNMAYERKPGQVLTVIAVQDTVIT